MSKLSFGTNQQTVTVATETALATLPINSELVNSGTPVIITATVACATGTGGTLATIKCRQGTTTAGTQVGPSVPGATGTANAATSVAYQWIDTAPPANGQYCVTLTFTGNSSSVVNSTISAELFEGVLA